MSEGLLAAVAALGCLSAVASTAIAVLAVRRARRTTSAPAADPFHDRRRRRPARRSAHARSPATSSRSGPDVRGARLAALHRGRLDVGRTPARRRRRGSASGSPWRRTRTWSWCCGREVPSATVTPGRADSGLRRPALHPARSPGGPATPAPARPGSTRPARCEYHDYAAPDGAAAVLRALRRQRPLGGGPRRAAAPRRGADLSSRPGDTVLISLDAPYADTTAGDLSFALGLPEQPALHVLEIPAAGLQLRLLGASHQVVLAGRVHRDGGLPAGPPAAACRPRWTSDGYRFTATVRRLDRAAMSADGRRPARAADRRPVRAGRRLPRQPGRGHRPARRGRRRPASAGAPGTRTRRPASWSSPARRSTR